MITGVPEGLADAAPGPPLAAGDGGGADDGPAIWTGLGSERVYQRPAPAIVITSTATSPASSPRDSVSRRSRIGMRATLGAEPRRHRDARHTGGHIEATGRRASGAGDEVHELRRTDDLPDDLPSRHGPQSAIAGP